VDPIHKQPTLSQVDKATGSTHYRDRSGQPHSWWPPRALAAALIVALLAPTSEQVEQERAERIASEGELHSFDERAETFLVPLIDG
jgi:hypothetical protein